MRRTVLTTTALAGALLLGACGAEAPEAAAPSDGAGQEETTAASGDAGGEAVLLSDIAEAGSAAIREQGTAHLTMTTSSSDPVEADVDYRGDSPAMAMTVTESGETVDLVLVDEVMYIGGDAMAEVTGGKRWVALDGTGEDMMSQMMGPSIEQMESSLADPMADLGSFGDREATVVSSEGGITTYEVVFTKDDLVQLVEDSSGAVPGVTEDRLDEIPEEGISYRLAVDEEDLPVSVTVDVDGQALELAYSDWGQDVDIAAPPADEVGTFRIPSLG